LTLVGLIRGLCLGALLFSLACADTVPDARDIVQRSIEFHGGIQAYHNLDSLSWNKTTRLLTEDGSLESSQVQRQSYFGGDDPRTTLQWSQDSSSHRIVVGRDATQYMLGDMVFHQGEMADRARQMALSATYVFFQPFKLLDQGTLLSYAGRMSFGDTLEVDVVRVSYEEDTEDADVWHYYFTDEGRFVANSVRHKGRISLIVNTEQRFHEPTGLLLHHKRKSYFVDSLLNIKYLRADYLYEPE
jgi:hypothetical protein